MVVPLRINSGSMNTPPFPEIIFTFVLLKPLAGIFGLYTKNAAERRGRELQGPSVGRIGM